MTDFSTFYPFLAAGLAGGGALGLTLAAARRFVPLTKLVVSDRQEKTERRSRTGSAPGGKHWGTARKSEIIGLSENGIIRYDDGFGCGWDMTPQTTMMSEDFHLDSSIDRLGRMLTSIDQPGTIIQLRIAKGPDIGRAIREHQLTVEPDADPLARELNAIQNTTYIRAASTGVYHQSISSVWARVPVELPGAMRRLGASTKQVVRDERDARDRAQSIFEMIERMSPLRTRRLNGEETWNALYRGHHEGVKSVPNFDRTSAIHASTLLAGDDLTLTGDRMIIDGQATASIVTLWLPPHPEMQADLARQLERAELGFRHTVIVEFEILDQDKAKSRLKRKIKFAHRNTKKADGRQNLNEDARGIVEQLTAINRAVSNNKDRLIATRYTIVVYGPSVTDVNDETQMDNARRILNTRCDALIAAMKTDTGSIPKREDQCTLEYIYPRTIVGEMPRGVTGREIIETSQTVAALAPVEAPWTGSPNPHTLLSLTSGRIIGLNLWDKSQIMSPTMLIVGGSGSGKSVLLGEIITNVLGTLSHATVRCIDFDESLGPLVELLNGKHLKFNSEDGEPRPLNVFDFDGLELGRMPDETQVTLVVEDLKLLTRKDDTDSENVLTIAVREIYEDFSRINGPGQPKQEPILSHVADHLKSRGQNFETPELRATAGSLAAALEKYRDHPWLDQPSHESFNDQRSRFSVYELNSLDGLPPAVKNSLAFRVAAKVGSTGGEKRLDGMFSPVLLGFDEGHKIKENYPIVYKALESIARRGNKQMVFQVIATQAWSDISDCPALIKNSSIKIFGAQNDQSDEIMEAVGLSPRANAALHALVASPGNFSQYLLVVGSGPQKTVERFQLELASVNLWTRTNNANERNARRRVQSLMPHWSLGQVLDWLATEYPRALESVGLKQIDESKLPRAA